MPLMLCVNHSFGLIHPPKLSLLCTLHNASVHTGHLIWHCLQKYWLRKKIFAFFFLFFLLCQICIWRRMKDAQQKDLGNLSCVPLHAVPTTLQGWTKMFKCMYLDKYCHTLICIYTLYCNMFPIWEFAYRWHITINAPQCKKKKTASLGLCILYIASDRSTKTEEEQTPRTMCHC